MWTLRRCVSVYLPFNAWLNKSLQSLAKHRLPVFSSVILCLSGVDDIKRRTKINKLVTKYGGVFVKNLERPVRVTHLLCSGEQETDKMHYAEKFNKKGEADIKLVWEEWFWDSLEYGGRFDEDKYQVRQPRPERRQLHIERRFSQQSVWSLI